jgi:hypothetical protein
MSKIQLTAKTLATVAKIRARLPVVQTEYGVNAIQRIHHEFSGYPLAVVEYALGRETADDIDSMIQYGCARRVA